MSSECFRRFLRPLFLGDPPEFMTNCGGELLTSLTGSSISSSSKSTSGVVMFLVEFLAGFRMRTIRFGFFFDVFVFFFETFLIRSFLIFGSSLWWSRGSFGGGWGVVLAVFVVGLGRFRDDPLLAVVPVVDVLLPRSALGRPDFCWCCLFELLLLPAAVTTATVLVVCFRSILYSSRSGSSYYITQWLQSSRGATLANNFRLRGKKAYLSPPRFIGNIHQPKSGIQFFTATIDFHLDTTRF